MVHDRKHLEELYFDEFLSFGAHLGEGQRLDMRHFGEAFAKGTQEEGSLMQQRIQLLVVAHVAKHCELFSVFDVETGASHCDPAVGHLREDTQQSINLRV